jgi:outer membrane protein assembly factor BamB
LNPKGLAIGIVLLFLVSIVPFINGESNARNGEDSISVQEDEFQYMNDWSVHLTNQSNNDESSPVYRIEDSNNNVNIKSSSVSGPMDSAWSMQSHDAHHTGLSPYSTATNPGAEIWRVRGESAGGVESTAVIDNNGIIYFGTMGSDSSLYALYPNGTRIWKYHTDGLIWSTPAIAEDGTIYVATWGGNYGGYLFAIRPNGTMKWVFWHVDSIGCSPTIGSDGTIYFGTMAGYFFAINPNGTEKWRLYLGGSLISSPAIGHDNTIYIGTTSNYFYAVNPNGSLRWQFGAGQFKGNPSIASDDTIYAPCFNGYLYAFYPNGTVKWQASTGGSIAGAGVALAEDGTIYIGTELLRAFYPNGTLKWSADVQGGIYGTVPAISAEGTIYVGAGGSLVAVNPDGTENWRKIISNEQVRSSPSIGNDGRVYVGSTKSDYGYLHAFGLGPLYSEAGGPYNGAMTQPLQFSGEAFGGNLPYQYYWDFSDGNTSEEQNPTHTYAHRGNYTAVLTVTDFSGNQSDDTAEVNIGYPLPKITIIKPVNALYVFNMKICNLPAPIVIGRITIIANVTQVDADIDRVEFYFSGDLQYTDTSPPYQWVWKGHPPPFDQDFLVRVYDTVGNRNEKMIYITKIF